MIGRLSWRCVALLVGTWMPSTGLAAAAVALERYQVTTYTQADGAPGSPMAVAQDNDGVIWITSNTALHRFDGARFERWRSNDGRPAPVEGAFTFIVDADNTLWVGSIGGGIAALRGGEARTYGARAGLPDGNSTRSVRRLLVHGERFIAATRGGLFQRQGERWAAFVPSPELKDVSVDDMIRDAAGRLWIKSPAAIFVLETDGTLRQLALPAGPDAVVAGLAAAPDGSVWYWSQQGERNFCRLWPQSSAACWRADEIHAPLFDRSGMLWWTKADKLLRVADVAALDSADPASLMRQAESMPLRSSGVFEARDGAIWAYGAHGFHRLRTPVLEKTDTPSGAVAPGDGGAVWVASYTRGLMRIADAGTAPGTVYKSEDDTLWTPAAKAGDAAAVFAPLARALTPGEAIVHERHIESTRAVVRLDRDSDGSLFVSRISPPGLTRVADGREQVIAMPELDRGAAPRGVRRDAKGNLWLGVSRSAVPLYRREGERWIANGGLPVPDKLTLVGFAFDRDDTLWIAAGRSGIVAVDAKGVRSFGVDEGVDIGTVGEVVVAADSLWAFGTRGVAVRQGERFRSLAGVGGERFLGITGLVVRPDGDVWLNGADGVTQIPAREWRAALATPGREITYTRLDHWDGVATAAANGPFPSLAASADGTLWFSMQGGLYRLRPGALPAALPPPAVLVDALTVDDTPRAVGGELAFAPGTYRIAVDFSAPGAQRPERTRFRYRVGSNGRWDPWLFLGTQRQIGFNRLDHGRYTLEIAASGRDGDWSDTPTRIAFRVLPAFHQTWMFYALVAAALGALLALAYAARVRQLGARIRTEMSARLRERERIARDLHDTLLQGIHGLLLNFQGIAGKLAADDPLRARMEGMLDRTEAVLREGRDRVSALRDPQASTLDLADALQRHARDLAVEKRILCEVAVPQAPRPLAPEAYEEILQIGREAIANAMRHSQGSQVRATLSYTDAGVLLSVIDDGMGLPEDADRRSDGHWGLRGMHERAQLVGALLTLRRRDEGGTEVKLFLPAASAYAGR